MPSYINSEEFKIDVRIEATARVTNLLRIPEGWPIGAVKMDDFSFERTARLRLQRILSEIWTAARRDGDVLAILHREFPLL